MRFHTKYHRLNHHTLPTIGYPDSASDPIASHEHPFKGDFVIDGDLYADTISITEALSSLEVDDLTINNPLTNLSVDSLTVTNFAANTDGSNFVNVNADTLDGLNSTDFEIVTNKNTINGYAGLDGDAQIFDGQIPEEVVRFDDYNETLSSAVLSPPSTIKLTRGEYKQLALSSSGMIIQLWDTPENSDSLTLLNYVNGSNTLSSENGQIFRSGHNLSSLDATILADEVQKWIYSEQWGEWLLTT